jgi:N-carbamoyl-L-amino-acid hydrolase
MEQIMSHPDFPKLWADLEPLGRSSSSGGYFRQPFTTAEREAAAWVLEQCRARDLEVTADEYGNVVAWWRPEGATGPGVLTGSHLDSVLDGGAYDGPLGVVSALAAIDLLRDRGTTPAKPIGVAVFVEEEGSRFGLACLGSRLLSGATTPTSSTATPRSGWRARSGPTAGTASTSPARPTTPARPAWRTGTTRC